jgi:tetratricopeptide (TPR) repeat protein
MIGEKEPGSGISLPLAAVLFTVAWLVFIPALFGEFLNWDDELYVTQNARVQTLGLSGWLALWSPRDALLGRFVEFFPLRDSIYALSWLLFPHNPLPIHAVAIFFHALNGILVSMLLFRLGAKRWGAFFGGLFFALHPVHVESVAWVSGLKDPLFCFFALGAALAFLHREKARWALPLSVVLLGAGFLVKAFIITWVPLVFLMAFLIRREEPRSVLKGLLPHIVLSVLFFGLFLAIGQANQVMKPPMGGNRLNALLLGLWCYWQYLGLLVFPLNLNTFYLMPAITSPLDWRAVISVLLMVGLGVGLWKGRWTHKRRAAFLFLGFGVALAPVLHLVSLSVLMADRYLYLASVVFCLALAWLFDRIPRKAALAAAVILSLLLSVQTLRRIAVWQDSVSVWMDAFDQPGGDQSPLVVMQLAAALFGRGEHQKAATLYQGILQLSEQRPVSKKYQHHAHLHLGWLALWQGRLEDAQRHVAGMESLQISSTHFLHLKGNLLLQQGKPSDAVKIHEQLEATGKATFEQRTDMAHVFAAAGQTQDALVQIKKVMESRPDLCPLFHRGPAGALAPNPCPVPKN